MVVRKQTSRSLSAGHFVHSSSEEMQDAAGEREREDGSGDADEAKARSTLACISGRGAARSSTTLQLRRTARPHRAQTQRQKHEVKRLALSSRWM